jgi:ABC-type transporter Mla maintaining outer membrane lipid asymmetry ATPase subunit MlaF
VSGTKAPDGPADPLLLEVEGLVVRGADGPARPRLEGIDWSLRAGELWVMFGSHGAGKSDLLFTLAGLERPAAGRLRWFGQDAAQVPEARSLELRRRIGLVFENGGRLFHRLTVQENVALPLCYHENLPWSEAGPQVEALLAALGLAPWAHVTPAQLPPAARPRVALARALVLRPSVLLLDNPVAGLGGSEMNWWRDILQQLAAGRAPTDGRASGVVVTALEPQPWLESGARFGRLHGGGWTPLGDRQAMLTSRDPVVREWLAAAGLSARPKPDPPP